jgi:hypothetical protein
MRYKVCMTLQNYKGVALSIKSTPLHILAIVVVVSVNPSLALYIFPFHQLKQYNI